MGFFKAIAVVGALVVGGLAAAQTPASASPLASGPAASARAEGALVTKAWHYGRPHGVDRRRVYRPVPVYRHVDRRRIYRPAPIYRPRPRVVCRTQYRVVRTAYGRVLRRPVQVCYRRY